ncbi:MAG: N-acetylmuramoyl-L-alanine amidase, partial [Rhodospirillaceae bacterium]|nr:N-acetylmuramoyl-L-alanine amidase [Rhodospirillaceae bacterium]
EAAKASEPAIGDRQRRAGGAKPVIILDPGHGGVDPGAIGVNGIYEKHITLAMGRQLKAHLEKTGRYKVVLTRDRDIFISLRGRVAIARRAHGDLFVSLHADSNPNRRTRGLSIYTLSERASDKEAALLADKENKSDIISGMDFSEESPEVTGILIDLAQRESMNLSAQFASLAVGELGRKVRTLSNTHRFAGFAVLKAPDIPSVLLEMGYLSNAEEVRLLQQTAYRERLSESMTHAVDRYFDQTQSAQRP